MPQQKLFAQICLHMCMIQEIDQIRSQTAKQLEGHLKTARQLNPTFGRKVLKTASGAESVCRQTSPIRRSFSRALSGAALLNAATASKSLAASEVYLGDNAPRNQAETSQEQRQSMA